MLICDGKPVDLKAPNGSASKFVISKIKELKDIGLPMRFNLPKDLANEIGLYDKRSEVSRPILEYSQGVRVRLTNNYRNPNGSLEQWTYYTDIKKTNNGKTEKYMPRWYELKKVNVFNEGDIELLFYLVYISGHCEAIEGVTDQNLKKKREYMLIEDRAREARKAAKRRILEAKVTNILYDLDKLSAEDLKILAKAYSISDADSVRELDVLRGSIYDIVVKSNDPNSIDKFMERANIDEVTKIQALITDAVDSGVLFVKKTQRGSFWMFKDVAGREGDLFHEVESGARPNKSLSSKLIASATMHSKLRAAVEERKMVSADEDESSGKAKKK